MKTLLQRIFALLPNFFALLALVALFCSLTWWGLRFWARQSESLMPPTASIAPAPSVSYQAVGALLGVVPEQQASATTSTFAGYQLSGVFAGKNRQGTAVLLTPEGKSKAFHIGSEVVDSYKLEQVTNVGVLLSNGNQQIELSIAAPQRISLSSSQPALAP